MKPPRKVHSGHLAGTMGSLAVPDVDKGRYVLMNQSSKAPGKINLKAVSEVLMERGLDPTQALIDILESGKLDADVQARILNELLQYTQPKLKSVEIKAKVAATAFDVNDEQAKRIAEEFLKSGVL